MAAAPPSACDEGFGVLAGAGSGLYGFRSGAKSSFRAYTQKSWRMTECASVVGWLRFWMQDNQELPPHPNNTLAEAWTSRKKE